MPIRIEPASKLLFIGDSITHQCLYTQYVENFYYTRFPNRPDADVLAGPGYAYRSGWGV